MSANVMYYAIISDQSQVFFHVSRLSKRAAFSFLIQDDNKFVWEVNCGISTKGLNASKNRID